ncbi:hypothetical protein AVEN_128816-1 [Araneus ventricosus]|uniref:RING-type domain-containing protein n=1 Tax=Araneus ventricosus TaxID=182803 RepID=A0A4Y2K683_ARAVE|nr:hypothetical protein AVEN_128816-1 [Araneus ventricosus]
MNWKKKQRVFRSASADIGKGIKGGVVTESALKRKHSQDVSDKRMASTMQTGTDTDAPRKRLRNENSGVTSAITQDATTSGENQLPSVPFQASGNRNHSPHASDGAATSSVLTGTDLDTHSAIVQEASTSGEGQAPSRDTPMAIDTPTEFACPLCPNTSFLRHQIKRLLCSHVFHQSCIDKWLSKNRYCPVCRAPYTKLTSLGNRRPQRKRRPRSNNRPL